MAGGDNTARAIAAMAACTATLLGAACVTPDSAGRNAAAAAPVPLTGASAAAPAAYQIPQRFADTLTTGDAEGFTALFATDAVHDDNGAARYQGSSDHRTYARNLINRGITVQILRVRSTGDGVTWIHAFGYRPAPPTRPARVIAAISNGRIQHLATRAATLDEPA
jgi:protein-tyrosine-phosphatase